MDFVIRIMFGLTVGLWLFGFIDCRITPRAYYVAGSIWALAAVSFGTAIASSFRQGQ